MAAAKASPQDAGITFPSFSIDKRVLNLHKLPAMKTSHSPEPPETAFDAKERQPNLRDYSKPEDLIHLPANSSPYNFGQLFDLEKRSGHRLAKAKLKQLKVLDPVIRAMLEPGEQVIYVTDGIIQNSFEQMFIGWIMYYYNHRAFVFTTERILMIHLTGKNKLGKFVGAIQYADLIEAKSSILGSLQLKFRSKKSLVFSRVARTDRTFIKNFLNPLIEENRKLMDKSAPTIIDLCPACYEPVESKSAPSCSNCETEYRTPVQAALRSLVLPGLGDLYLGSSFAFIEIPIMALIWFSMVTGNIALAHQGEDPVALWVSTFLVMGVIHLLDAFKSHYVARKGIFPREKIAKIRERQATV